MLHKYTVSIFLLILSLVILINSWKISFTSFHFFPDSHAQAVFSHWLLQCMMCWNSSMYLPSLPAVRKNVSPSTFIRNSEHSISETKQISNYSLIKQLCLKLLQEFFIQENHNASIASNLSLLTEFFVWQFLELGTGSSAAWMLLAGCSNSEVISAVSSPSFPALTDSLHTAFIHCTVTRCLNYTSKKTIIIPYYLDEYFNIDINIDLLP